jgi:hypothetical protein
MMIPGYTSLTRDVEPLLMLEIWFFDEFMMIPGYTSLTRDGRAFHYA